MLARRTLELAVHELRRRAVERGGDPVDVGHHLDPRAGLRRTCRARAPPSGPREFQPRISVRSGRAAGAASSRIAAASTVGLAGRRRRPSVASSSAIAMTLVAGSDLALGAAGSARPASEGTRARSPSTSRMRARRPRTSCPRGSGRHGSRARRRRSRAGRSSTADTPDWRRGLHDQPRDRLALVDEDRLGAADEPRRLEVGGILDLGDDLVRRLEMSLGRG